MINNVPLYILYDCCHLLKCLRNLWMNYDFLFERRNEKSIVTSWKTLEQVYKYEKESKNLVRNLYYLNDEHVIKDKCP